MSWRLFCYNWQKNQDVELVFLLDMKLWKNISKNKVKISKWESWFLKKKLDKENKFYNWILFLINCSTPYISLF